MSSTASAESSSAPAGAEAQPRSPRRRVLRSIARAAALLIAAALLLPLFVLLALRWIDPPTSAFMLRHALARQAVHYRWTDLDHIAPAMALAAVAAEDQLFPSHHGFDLDSISDAMTEHRARRRGASTLTQQVAKNLFLWPGHSWLRKGVEAYLAAAIELLWPKRRILEVYLNVAELGPDLYGVGAAADHYFHQSAAKLTRREAALLAAALPSPRRSRPDRPSPWLSERARWIERQIDQLGGEAHLAGILGGAPKSGARN